LAAGGIEPGPFKSSGEYANHYTTVTPLAEKRIFYNNFELGVSYKK